jgi:hypothetical protein
MTNPTNKRSFIHKANKNRTSESDIPNKFKVMEIIKENFGLYPLTDEVLPIPEGGFAEVRMPDLLIKNCKPNYIIELVGPVHNPEKEHPARRIDIKKAADYARLGQDYKVVELWGGYKNEYSEEHVVSTLKEAGVPANEYQIRRYRERKERNHRYA